MPESEGVPDVYIDQVQINTSPYGATINFLLSSRTPPAPGATPEAERKATVRMSLEHLKMMSYILQRQVRQHEQETGVAIGISPRMITATGIPVEDWDSFWS